MRILRKKSLTALLLCAALIICAVCGGAEEALSAYEAYLAGGEAPSLAEKYAGAFQVGVNVSPAEIKDARTAALIAGSFSVLSCDEQLAAKTLLDRSASKKGKDETHAKVKFSPALAVLSFAEEKGMTVRFPALAGQSGTPRWFFSENWASSEKAPLVDRDTMIKRLENYIRDVMEYVNEKYPGVVCVWDVAESAGEDDLWLETIGSDYAEIAFACARQCAADGQAMYYRASDCEKNEKMDVLLPFLRELREKGLADGLTMDVRFSLDAPGLDELENAVSRYAEAGLSLSVAGLAAEGTKNTALSQLRLAACYRDLFSLLDRLKAENGCDIRAVAMAALADADAGGSLLLDREYRLKPAYFGALQDRSIPKDTGDEALRAAAEKLGLEKIMGREETKVNVVKTLNEHNPVMTQRFGADPWAMEYKGRVYLYMTGDEPMLDAKGKPITNNYSNITTLRVISSDDLVNWQDHGSVRAAGRTGAAKWASNSWAPCAAWKTIDGQDRFFLYFANSGGGIGVLTADSPTGPFTDPLGKALVSRNTPTCREVTWLFDPAVLVDDDGSAYLYFGGGIPEGRAADPGTARVVKLGDDMISLDGDPVAISPPWLFEDSGINKFGDTYVYSYCSNFNVPGTSKEGFQSGEIVYLTSSSPMGPFTYGGRVLKNPSAYFGVGGNNHHCMFEFQGRHYITYHAATVDKKLGWNAGYRSTFVDALMLNEQGLPALSNGTYRGVPQLKPFDPFQETPAATLAAIAGAQTLLAHPEDRGAGTGDMLVKSEAKNSWIAVAGVDFGEEGAGGVKLCYTSEEAAAIEILLDSPDSAPAAEIPLTAVSEARSELFSLPETITGVHDVYFRFSQPNIQLLTWQFFSPLQAQ